MNVRLKIFLVIEPKYNNKDSKLSVLYDWIMLISIMVSIIPLMFHHDSALFRVFDVAPCSIFIIDYILRWMTADIRSGKKGITPFLVYPFQPMAIIDLLSILPTFTIVKEAFKVGRFVRLMKIARVIKVVRYYEPLAIVTNVIKKQRVLLTTVLSLAIFYVFVTALIMFNIDDQIDPETGQALFHSFFDAFYWAACTLTTVGYGDIYPISTIGRVISIISSMVGIAIIALPSGIITAGYMDEINDRKRNG